MQAAERKGRADGILIGKEEGILIGKEEGVEIGERKTAVNLIALGMDDEFIAKATTLSLEEVRKLRGQ